MRILALLSLLLTVACVLGMTAAAIGQDDVDTVPTGTVPTVDENVPDDEEFGRDFEDRAQPDPEEPKQETRPLVPMDPEAQPAGTAALPRTGTDERVLVAAAYWLLLGGVALRRASRLA